MKVDISQSQINVQNLAESQKECCNICDVIRHGQVGVAGVGRRTTGKHNSGVIDKFPSHHHCCERNIGSWVGVAQPYLVGGGSRKRGKFPPKRLLGKEGLK